ncbi:MAG: hypothetical protein M3Z04_09980, partial [Chloroflexota bacterium]|nr:hypothetical protein [Chloroflexota bacterium]
MTNRHDRPQDEHRRHAQQATEGRTATLTPAGAPANRQGDIEGIQGRDGLPPDVALLKRLATQGVGRGNGAMFQQLTQQVSRKYGNAYVTQILSDTRRSGGDPQVDGAEPGLSPHDPPLHLSDIDTRNVPRPPLNLPPRQTLGLPKPTAAGATTAPPVAETTTATPPKSSPVGKPGPATPTHGHSPHNAPATHPTTHKAGAPKGTAPHKTATPQAHHAPGNGAGHT